MRTVVLEVDYLHLTTELNSFLSANCMVASVDFKPLHLIVPTYM